MDVGFDDGVGSVRRERPPGHRCDQLPRAGAEFTDCSTPPGGRRTSPGSSSSTRGRATSTRTGRARPTITVALLRAEAGRYPSDTQLRELVGELSTVSEEFRTRWAAHNVRIHHNGAKRFRHPVVGALDLAYYTLDLPTEDHRGLRLTIYTAEPRSPSEDALKLLASWAATNADASPSPVTDRL